MLYKYINHIVHGAPYMVFYVEVQSTSGIGTTGADIIFQTGNNGSTEVMRILNNGNIVFWHR